MKITKAMWDCLSAADKRIHKGKRLIRVRGRKEWIEVYWCH